MSTNQPLVEWQEQKLAKHFVLTPVGLTVIGQPDFDLWALAGVRLGQAHNAVRLGIGDWLRFGEQTYGEMYSQALDVTGLDYSTLSTYKWVSGKIASSRRNENLSWSHHREVAPLEPNQQDRWLALAEERELTRDELRRAIKESGQSPEGPPDPDWSPDTGPRLQRWLTAMAHLGFQPAFCDDCGGPGLEHEERFRCYKCGGITDGNS